jgi:signal transduction histidine kinase
MQRRAIALAIGVLASALGLFALRVERDEPAYSLAGDSIGAAVTLLAAGWALLASGLASWLRRPESRFGPLLAAAGLAWFLPELANPESRSAVAFTAALALSGACAALVAHATLAYPGGRLRSGVERTIVTVAYVAGVLLLGALPTAFSDPRQEGCAACPGNLLFLGGDGSLPDDLTKAGLVFGLAASLVVAALCLRRGATAARASPLVLAAGAAYLAFVSAEYAVFLDRGFLDTGTLARRLWFGEAGALLALAGAVGWGLARARRARSAVARLVVDLAQSPPPGGLRDALAGIVGDPGLVLAYPLEQGDRLVDADGAPLKLPEGRQQTTLVRDGRPVAVVAHAPGLLDDEQLVEELTSAARLALENERLRAEVRARLDELRASRARIVAAGDAERRRLERDLHDGAQQRLVGLSLSLRLLRTRVSAPKLAQADDELRVAITELRELAHGIFPAVLADEGLAAAVEALAEEAAVPLRLGCLTESRFEPAVETAAYTVVANVVRAARAPVDVRTARANGALVVELDAASVEGIDVVDLEDRVGALDGRLSVDRGLDGQVHVRAELPCGS